MRNERLLTSRRAGAEALLCILLVGWLLIAADTARADYSSGGTLDSLEWLVDSSSRIVVATIVPLDRKPHVGESKYALRIVAILKQTKTSTDKVGELLSPSPVKELPTAGRQVVLFLDPRSNPAATTMIELPANYRPEKDADATDDDNLAVDETGSAIRDPKELLKRIAERVEAGRRSTRDHSPKVSDAGFTYESNKFYGNDAYYYLRVPPDACIRAMLEKATDIEAKALLYRYFANRIETQRTADRQADLRRNVEEAKARFRKSGPYLSYQSVVTYPEGRHCNTSPNGKYTALLEGDLLLLYATEDDSLVYRGPNSYHNLDPLGGLIFSPDGNYFAHLHANGDVAVFNLAKRKRQSIGKLGWPVADDTHPYQFTFSPNSRYLALNLAHGAAGRGSAVLVWNTETGERLYTKSKNWELNKELYLVGFGPYSEDIQVSELSYFNLAEKRPLSFVGCAWHLPNPDSGSWNDKIPTLEITSPPGDRPKTSGGPAGTGR